MPALRPRRFLPTVLMIVTAFFVVTQPHKAAAAVNTAMDAVQKIAQALTVFSDGLG
ncbi:hypothetical protein ACFFV7_32425 [Nonomuraea spiralis]|uniref:Uncharacterized protein n=1 Tax=Nonomuraea spiralis TaxID=46182 RepID=A0ABV5IN08_9ACTN|nr:hypothetical protein [Nonomuraea spiralis]GGT38300.1 hypothetical protein GCM10010176_097930 [Nonomuraea spiralis]